MRILVTGGAGFIGSHLVDALIERGDRVTVLDNLSSGRRENLHRRARLVVGDILDAGLVGELLQDAEQCFHLAATPEVPLSVENWIGTHKVNQTGSLTVFDAARQGCHGPVPVVYASSAAVYGATAGHDRLTEASRLAPLSAYGADKLGSELHARVAWHVHRLPTTGLRFFNVYGPRQKVATRFPSVMAEFLRRIPGGEPVDIHGDGNQIRDFIHVCDIVGFLLRAAQRQRPGAIVLNACSGRPTSICELAQDIGALTGRKPILRFTQPRAGDIAFSVGDPSAAAAALGYVARTSLTDGLRTTLQLQPPELAARAVA